MIEFQCDVCGEHYEEDEMNEVEQHDVCDQCIDELGAPELDVEFEPDF